MRFHIAGLAAALLLTAGLTTVKAEVSLTQSFVVSKTVGERQFLNPQSVYVDRVRGDIYVADTGNGRITISAKDGYPTGGFDHRPLDLNGGSSEPIGVAVDSKGRIYVTDASSSCIFVYDYRGRLKQKMTVTGLDGDPPLFGRMTVDSKDNIYVVVRNKGVICVVDSKGSLIRKVGTSGKGEGKFEMLADVAVDSSGNIYALDTLGIPVQVFDPQGRFTFGFGMHATGPGNFAHPTAVEVDESGRIWVVDSFAQMLKVYDSHGQLLNDFPGYFFPIDLAYLPSIHRLYVLEKNGGRLFGQDVKS